MMMTELTTTMTATAHMGISGVGTRLVGDSVGALLMTADMSNPALLNLVRSVCDKLAMRTARTEASTITSPDSPKTLAK